jgi:hypothetical protein
MITVPYQIFLYPTEILNNFRKRREKSEEDIKKTKCNIPVRVYSKCVNAVPCLKFFLNYNVPVLFGFGPALSDPGLHSLKQPAPDTHIVNADPKQFVHRYRYRYLH